MRDRVVIVTSNFWPEPTGIGQVVTEFADFLAKRGLRVDVVTAMPFYPEWRIWPLYRGRVWMQEYHANVRILRAWHLVTESPTAATRLLHEGTLSVSAFPLLVRGMLRAKRALIVTPDLAFGFVAVIVARIMGVPVTLMVQDIQPDAAIELGMLRNPVVISVSRWIARTAYHLADEIHTLGEGMRRRVAQEVSRPEKVRVVPVTIDADELAPVPPEQNEFRRRFVRPDTFVALHTGNMGVKQDLDVIIRTALRARSDRSIEFLVFGDGAVREEFLARRESLGLGNVRHYPLQERSLLRHMLSGADVVLVTQAPGVVDIVVPSKLMTAMAAGAMIIVAADPESEAAHLMRSSGGGLAVPASDDAALAVAIERVKRGKVDVSGCRHKARDYAVRHFGREDIYGPLADTLASPEPATATIDSLGRRGGLGE